MPFTIDTTTPFGERAERRLRDDKVAWLTTTSGDGTPQPVPVWFLWDGGDSFLIYSRPGTAKLRNIGERPRVSLHLDGNGQGGDIVVVLGDAASATIRRHTRCPATSRSTRLHRAQLVDARVVRGRLLRAAAPHSLEAPRLLGRGQERRRRPLGEPARRGEALEHER